MSQKTVQPVEKSLVELVRENKSLMAESLGLGDNQA
jgi:hypothetical protein